MKELKIVNSKQSDVDAFMAEILLLESLPVHKNLVRFLFHHQSSDRVRIFMRRYESTLDTWLLVRRDWGWREITYIVANEISQQRRGAIVRSTSTYLRWPPSRWTWCAHWKSFMTTRLCIATWYKVLSA